VSRLFLIAVLLLGACDKLGDTCGRGRCPHNTCLSIFADTPLKRSNQGWRDKRYPQVDNEWWCERTCPKTKTCPGMCLEDPADSDTVVCATDSVHVVYYSRGHSILEGLANQEVLNYDVLPNPSPRACLPQPSPMMNCRPTTDCDGGMLHSGDVVPAVQLSNAQGKKLLYCPGDPDNLMGPQLPQAKTVRIYVDQD